MIDLLRHIKHAVLAPWKQPDPFPEDAWTDPTYSSWLEHHRATLDELEAQRASREYKDTSFSIIVPLYRTPLDYLSDMIESVLAQTHAEFELILVNGSAEDPVLSEALCIYQEVDSRVKVVSLEENRGIAGNTAAGLTVATNDYVVLIDHDDRIEPDALFEYARAIEMHPDAPFYYCDEDLFEAGDKGEFVYKNPLFKPDFSRSLLACKNYILHMLCFQRTQLEARGVPDPSYDGAQDYKMIIDALGEGVVPHHIPKVLYHWRISEASTATNPDSKPYGKIAYQKCLQEISQRDWDGARIVGTDIENLFDPWCTATNSDVSVSLVIDVVHEDDVVGFLQRFEGINSFANCELIFVGSSPVELPPSAYRISWVKAPANAGLFERLDQGARSAQGTHFLFLDAGCSFLSPEPLEQLVNTVERSWIGVVAPKVLYADRAIKGYGIAVTPERIMPLYRGFPGDWTGYQCNLRALQENSACGWQGVIISKKLFESIGGFDGRFTGEIGMADLCHRAMLTHGSAAVICTVMLMTSDACPQEHYDNATNAPDFAPEDLALFDEKWPDIRAAGDPYFNKNLDQSSSYFQIALDS